MDWLITRHLNALMVAHDGVEDQLRTYVIGSEGLFAVLLIAVIVIGALRQRSDLASAGIAGGLGAGAALLAGQLLSHIVDRARPFVTHPQAVHAFIAHAPDPGFPSDHAIAAFAIAAAIWLRHRWLGSAALAAAVLLAVGRVALGVHYPSDVIVGAALGIAGAGVWSVGPGRRWIDALAAALIRPVRGGAPRTSSPHGSGEGAGRAR